MSVADQEIVKAIADPESKGGVVAASSFVMRRLAAAGLCSDMTLAPKQLGIHPSNRGAYGVNEESVHLLGSDIMEIGWCSERVVGGIAVEEDPLDRYIERYNIDIASASERLAPIEPMSLRAGTLTNGHTVLFLRALVYGVPSSAPKLSVDGHMSLAHVAESSPSMASAAQCGWSWSVLHHTCRGLYGDKLFRFLSDAANVSVNRQESEAQAMLKLHNMALDAKARGVPIVWADLHKAVLRTKPAFAESVPLLAQLVRDYGGGVEGNFVSEFAQFHRRFVPNERVVPASFYEALLAMVFREGKGGVAKPLPLLRWALLKTQYTSPPAKVVNRECKLLNRSDLEGLAKRRYADAVECETILAECREITHKLTPAVPEATRVKLFGRLDCSVARLLVKKQAANSTQYSSVMAAACAFHDELRAAVGHDLTNPWAAHRDAPKTAEVMSSNIIAGDDLKSFSVAGSAIQADAAPALKAVGFSVGMEVALKSKPAEKLVIVSVGESVRLRKADNTETLVLLGKFVSQYTKYEELFLEVGPDNDARTHENFQLVSFRAVLLSGLHSLSSTLKAPAVRVMVRPSRKVFATQAYKPNQLVLAPEALSIQSSTGSPPSSASVIKVDGPFKEMTFYLCAPPLPTGKGGLLAPFWLVRAACEDDANMVLAERTVEVQLGAKGASTSTSTTIVFPVLRNKKAIHPGDELIVSAPAAAQETPEGTESAKGGKRRKTTT